jgi:hypothetical protein
VPNSGDPHPLLGLSKIVIAALVMLGAGLFLYWVAGRKRNLQPA